MNNEKRNKKVMPAKRQKKKATEKSCKKLQKIAKCAKFCEISGFLQTNVLIFAKIADFFFAKFCKILKILPILLTLTP